MPVIRAWWTGRVLRRRRWLRLALAVTGLVQLGLTLLTLAVAVGAYQLTFDLKRPAVWLLTLLGHSGLKREEIAVAKAEPLKRELAAFVECVRTGQTPKIDVRFGKAALEIALTITAQIKASGL